MGFKKQPTKWRDGITIASFSEHLVLNPRMKQSSAFVGFTSALLATEIPLLFIQFPSRAYRSFLHGDYPR